MCTPGVAGSLYKIMTIETALIILALLIVFTPSRSAAYFARFHTSSAFPPPDAAVLVYFISSPVIVTDRF